MRMIAALAAILGIAGCRGISEPDDVETPTYHPSIVESLRQEVRMDPPQGENIQYLVFSNDDRKALTPWLTSLSEAESKRREFESGHPLLTFTILWRSHPAPTGGVLLVPTQNETGH